MGAIQSACPVRKAPAAQAKKVEGTVASQSPNHSTKRFEGGSLRGNAESFMPPGLGPLPEIHNVPVPRVTANQRARAKAAAAAAAAAEAPTVNRSDPDWAQYLQKKAVEKYGPRQAEQRAHPRTGTDQKRTGAAAAPPAANFTLQTSEYLKLLKDGEQSKHSQKATSAGPPGYFGPKLGSKDNLVVGLKNDLSAALDSIIKTQQSNQFLGRKKTDMFDKMPKDGLADSKINKVPSFLAQMVFGKDGAEEEPEDVVARVQDDMFCERQNRDEDLAVPCYWSDDDQGPRAVKRASAHSALGKVPGVRPRQYVTQKLDDDLDHQVAIFLLHLRRLSDRQRAIEPKGGGKKRLIVGLKEVARSVRQGKVKCVVVAPDIEEIAQVGGGSAGVADRIQEITQACYKLDTPVIFALSRSRIGNALGKSLRMSALAVLDTSGVNDLYDQILEQSYAQRVAWLARQPKPEPPMSPWKAKAAAKAALKKTLPM